METKKIKIARILIQGALSALFAGAMSYVLYRYVDKNRGKNLAINTGIGMAIGFVVGATYAAFFVEEKKEEIQGTEK